MTDWSGGKFCKVSAKTKNSTRKKNHQWIGDGIWRSKRWWREKNNRISKTKEECNLKKKRTDSLIEKSRQSLKKKSRKKRKKGKKKASKSLNSKMMSKLTKLTWDQTKRILKLQSQPKSKCQPRTDPFLKSSMNNLYFLTSKSNKIIESISTLSAWLAN